MARPYHGQRGIGSGLGYPGPAVWPYGLWGDSEAGPGVAGTSRAAPPGARPPGLDVGFGGAFPAGVFGEGSGEGTYGVYGFSEVGTGVRGEGGTGVSGSSENGTGVSGSSEHGDGMYARTESNAKNGIFARNDDISPIPPNSGPVGNGVFGLSMVPNASGVFGANNSGGIGVFGISGDGIGVKGTGGELAGLFEGNVEVTGDIRLRNADCAEEFDIAEDEQIEPGSVVVIDDEGVLRVSWQAYDKRVAGVISGADTYRPGLILDKRVSQANRMPVALMGKVACRVDAQYSPIEVGDLLTTSPTPGQAMKAANPFEAFGAVIGKALRPLTEGQGIVPILVALQ